MNAIIDKFGHVVTASIQNHPGRALQLLKLGYGASGLQAKVLPNRQLLPHQQYAALNCNRAIQKPLQEPGNSAVVNLFLPCELLQAMGLAPQFVEGLAGYLDGACCEHGFIEYAEDWGIPRTYCSYHKTLLGAALSSVLEKPRFIVQTTLACDANMNTFRTLAEHWQVPLFVLDVPDVCTGETVDYVAEQFRRMSAFMEDVTGMQIDSDRLREVIRLENRSARLYAQYRNQLSTRYIPNDATSEMNKIFFTHVLAGTTAAEKYFSMMLEDAEKAASAGDKVRILWIHTLPFWQDSIREIFAPGSKYQLLGSDLNFDFLDEMDEERPFEAMARKALRNSMGGDMQRRTGRAIEMAKVLKADGVVWFCQWGCKQTLGAAYLAKEMIESAGYPVLLLDGDGCDRQNINEGQMATRLHAFLEMLGAPK
ncbi:MAG: 2-hydroxyacyl-CoA dehydratase family protein [Spirochaetaceae bacterium]|nr:2-hydroxyacyl-CoA dehydratase family protein [Spirochaetaceae bacterium]